MRKKIIIIFVFASIMFCINGSVNEIHAAQNANSATQSIVEHHNEEDQIYVENHISIITESIYITIEQSSKNLRKYHNQIWKPPVNS